MFLLTFFSVLIALGSSTCGNPPPAQTFSLNLYLGKWYQIAKYQTAGGAYFEKNCTCTEINVATNAQSTIYAIQSCIKNGQSTAINATLIPTQLPGKFVQKIGGNKVNFWIIQLDQDTAVTYDCNDVLGVTNYCIHILSRKTTLQTSSLQRLSKFALDMGLNPNNLVRAITDQVKCRSTIEQNLSSQE